MKLLFALIFVVIVALMLRPTYVEERAKTDCKLVCADNGYGNTGYVQTGFFTFRCLCKAPKKKAPTIYGRP